MQRQTIIIMVGIRETRNIVTGQLLCFAQIHLTINSEMGVLSTIYRHWEKQINVFIATQVSLVLEKYGDIPCINTPDA